MLNAHTELRAKRQRSAREAMYRNRPFQEPRVPNKIDDMAGTMHQALPHVTAAFFLRSMARSRMPRRMMGSTTA